MQDININGKPSGCWDSEYTAFCKLEEVMNKKVSRISILLIGLVAMLYFVWLQKNNPAISYKDVTMTISAPNNASSAYWKSKARTVEDLMSESDLVVRVRVSKDPVTRVVPIYPLDPQGNKIESAVFPVLFSDTVFEVLETYVGKSLQTVTVMQTGGYDPGLSNNIEEMTDDPLYKAGEVYILFLVNISGDPVHAQDRDLYITVNPFGRYRIDSGNFFTYGQNVSGSNLLPTSIADLEQQIVQAAKELNK